MLLKEYKHKLTLIFRYNTTRGFADWRHCGRLEVEVAKFLELAAIDLLRDNRDKELFDLICAAFLKWGKTDKDDSNGETQDFLCVVFDLWDRIYVREHSDITHPKMMAWFLKKMDGSVIDYMEEWLLEYVMKHFKEAALLEKKLVFLNDRIAEREALIPEKSWAVYDIYRYKEYILQIYAEQKRPIEVIREYASGIQRNDARELLAKIELEYGHEDECLKIYEALAADVVRGWDPKDYNVRLKELYKQFGRQEKYEAQVKKLLKMNVGHMGIWNEYKALVPAEAWDQTVIQLFSTFRPEDCRPLTWYAAEGRYDLVMTGIEHGGPDYLDRYEAELISRFPHRCREVLEKAADEAVENSHKRSDYHRIAGYLRRMWRYPGGMDKASQLAVSYCERYPRRSAMIDELQCVILK